MHYSKPWKSYSDQLQQLVDRGMIVTDHAKAEEKLECIGYYRLSGYWLPFRERTGIYCPLEKPTTRKTFKKGSTDKLLLDTFKEGASFENALSLYVFDKNLRLLVLDALERIEVALRVDISHLLGKEDVFSYTKPEHFFDNFVSKLDPSTGLSRFHHWQAKHASLVQRSNEIFIKHNKSKYGLPLAIWIACEVWDFGCLSTLYSGMKVEDQDKISDKYGIQNGRTFSSWLRSLNYLRNVCAHHSRLWNRNIIDQPKLPNVSEIAWIEPYQKNSRVLSRPFLLLCITKHLMDVINPNSSWGDRLVKHLNEFPDLASFGIDLTNMGASESWQEEFENI